MKTKPEGPLPPNKRVSKTDDQIKGSVERGRRTQLMEPFRLCKSFAEAMEADPMRTSTLVCAIWQHCIEIGYMLEYWSILIVVMICKIGNENDQKRYRTTARAFTGLQNYDSGHWEIVMETAIYLILRDKADFKKSQAQKCPLYNT